MLAVQNKSQSTTFMVDDKDEDGRYLFFGCTCMLLVAVGLLGWITSFKENLALESYVIAASALILLAILSIAGMIWSSRPRRQNNKKKDVEVESPIAQR